MKPNFHPKIGKKEPKMAQILGFQPFSGLFVQLDPRNVRLSVLPENVFAIPCQQVHVNPGENGM